MDRKKQVQIVSPDEVEAKFKQASDRGFVTVTFIKRSDGSPRTMTCRRRVTKYLKGGPPAYDPNDHALIWVWETTASAVRAGSKRGGYKSIPVAGIILFESGGIRYYVRGAGECPTT